MNVSTAGLSLIREFEGCKLEAYICPAGIPTVGVGHTKGVKLGDKITEAEALDLLREDVRWCERAIDESVNVSLTQNQYDALASFCFNVGAFAFASSTLVKKLNDGDKQGAADQFLRWNKAKGKELPGLTRRREAERSLFLA